MSPFLLYNEFYKGIAIDFYNNFSVYITELSTDFSDISGIEVQWKISTYKSFKWLTSDFRITIDFIMIFYLMISIDYLNTSQFKSLT